MNNFQTISSASLSHVTGGKTSSTDQQLKTMLTDISSSIKDAADAKNKQGTDPTTMMMMMMMMGGGGGGGGATQVAAAPPPAAPPAVVRVNVRG